MTSYDLAYFILVIMGLASFKSAYINRHWPSSRHGVEIYFNGVVQLVLTRPISIPSQSASYESIVFKYSVVLDDLRSGVPQLCRLCQRLHDSIFFIDLCGLYKLNYLLKKVRSMFELSESRIKNIKQDAEKSPWHNFRLKNLEHPGNVAR